MKTTTVSATTARTAEGIMRDLADNARVLAQRANDTDVPSVEQIEKAMYVLLTESLQREDTRDIILRTLTVVGGREAGLVDVA